MNRELLDSQISLHTLEDLSQLLCSNKYVSSREILLTVRSIVDNNGKLQSQVESAIESWLNVQDLMRSVEMESHNIETSLTTVETFLHQSTLHDWNSTTINARLNEIQVNNVNS